MTETGTDSPMTPRSSGQSRSAVHFEPFPAPLLAVDWSVKSRASHSVSPYLPSISYGMSSSPAHQTHNSAATESRPKPQLWARLARSRNSMSYVSDRMAHEPSKRSGRPRGGPAVSA